VADLIKLPRDGVDFYAEEHDDWYRPDRDQMAIAWSQEGCLIHVRGQENVDKLKTLYERVLANDIALADPSGMGFVDRRGLSLVVASLVPQAVRDDVMAKDVDAKRLRQAATDTGIEQTLKDAGKRFYALSPAWANEEKTAVRFFLNPAEQNKYNYGWYDVDQLKQWARDEGPIVKTEPTPTARKRAP
jgi:hypothetical protein